MKDIFTDLYNKVLGFFRQTEKKEEEENTKDVACNRLKFVLMQDRTNLSPELMDRMRKELIDLLSKYVEMDKEALELGFEQEGSQMALMLSIPVVRAKEESEIEAILAKEDEEKANKEKDIETAISEDIIEDSDISDDSSSSSEEEDSLSEDDDTTADNSLSDDIEEDSVISDEIISNEEYKVPVASSKSSEKKLLNTSAK